MPDEINKWWLEEPVELQREMAEYYEDRLIFEESEIYRGIQEAIFHKDGPLPASEDSLAKWEQWLYIIKAAFCWACGLRKGKRHGSYPYEIEIIVTHSGTLYAGWEADWITVGHGFFRNWFVSWEHDSDWNM